MSGVVILSERCVRVIVIVRSPLSVLHDCNLYVRAPREYSPGRLYLADLLQANCL